MEDMIKKLPKTELHLHIEGSLEPELMFSLAERNNIKLPYDNVKEIRAAYEFSNLQDFLDIYYAGASVLIQEQDFYDLTDAYIKKCVEDNIVHAEIFFDPQTHTDRGISFGTVIKGISRALEDAQRNHQISSKIIMCYLRHLSEEECFKTLEQSLPFKDLIYAVGLDSSEAGHPPSKFENLFEASIKAGYVTVAHAGEEGPAGYIWEALDLLKVKRVDHGVRCSEDPRLVKRLLDEKIPLTVCPLSNLKLCVVDKLSDHNLKDLLQQGLMITINSDDPAYFGGYLNTNFIETAKALDLSEQDIITLCKNSFHASFLSDSEKESHLKRIDALTV